MTQGQALALCPLEKKKGIDMRLLIVLASLCWAIPASAQITDRQAIIDVVDRFLEAINSSDADAYAALQLDDGMTYAQIYGADGEPKLRPRSNAQWVDLIRGETANYRERYWDPTILIHRDIAVFWAPYSFDENGKRAHCGVDVFELVRVAGEWKIANSMWTIEPQGCPKG